MSLMEDNKDEEILPNWSPLNKSFSFPRQSRKLLIEQQFENNRGERLVRHLSYEHVNVPTHRSPRVYMREYYSSADRLKQSVREWMSSPITFPPDQNKTDFTNQRLSTTSKKSCKKPLADCDNSTNRMSLKDYDDNQESNINEATIKDENAKANKDKTEKSKKSKQGKCRPLRIWKRIQKFTTLRFFIYVSVPLVLSLLCMSLSKDDVELSQEDCDKRFDGTKIVAKLKKNLYEQSDVINGLADVFNATDDKKIIVFAGGTGVGKTYAASMVASEFSSNVFKVASPSRLDDKKKTDILKKVSFCGYNLVILDGLEEKNLNDIIPFVKELLSKDIKLIVIIVVNIQTVDDELTPFVSKNNLQAYFENFKPRVLQFNQLNESTIKLCIEDAMTKLNVPANDRVVDDVLNSIDFKFGGCKRVYSKVALMN